MENNEQKWISCPDCQGQGKKSRGLSKRAQVHYQAACETFRQLQGEGPQPIRPKAPLYRCATCSGSGLVISQTMPVADGENRPHIAIIGGGIGGLALAVACLHRGIPFSLFERDLHFQARAQGYGLTLQQASKAIKGLGILSLEEAVVSTRHLVHTTSGKVIGEWGLRKWLPTAAAMPPKSSNLHIPRQTLRLALLEQLGGAAAVHWNHQLSDLKHNDEGGVNLSFRVGGENKKVQADLVVGADGIRSTVRRLLLGDDCSPLQYLGCIVILGICPLDALGNQKHELLDSATVFQTANGHERIYMMPYTADTVMWQLSFPLSENAAQMLSAQGPQALKAEASRRTQWHSPIPQIVAATAVDKISGYPVYDRELLDVTLMADLGPVTLIGDAAHPMSPFKGQGANQALLDALTLARQIYRGTTAASNWRIEGIRPQVLDDFETEMMRRSASKVRGSAEAAQILHSELALYEGNQTRGHQKLSPS
ncbi:FAD-dependent oxidoreductase [Flavobacterium sp. JP2137]|uniref:FAD-dependent oxidoreductase n=1 Tax=Flavobacterium sp. JP2137 TaxID=3414510 RepID=UPI003D2FC331